MNKKVVIVEKTKKIINFLQDYGFSYSDASKILRNKDVRINGVAEKNNILVNQGDEVTFFYTDDMLAKKYEIVYESENVYIIYKFSGIESEGEKGIEKALPNAIAVHRLDRNTEGLMVFAKNQETKTVLDKAIKERKIKKYYLAEVVGRYNLGDSTFKAYLKKDSDLGAVKIFKNKVDGSVEILTGVKTVFAGNQSSVVEVELITGKTHQIRAHLAFLGFPIIGDGKYGKEEVNKKFKQSRQMLACCRLMFDRNIEVEELKGKVFKKMPVWYFDKK